MCAARERYRGGTILGLAGGYGYIAVPRGVMVRSHTVFRYDNKKLDLYQKVSGHHPIESHFVKTRFVKTRTVKLSRK